MCGTCLICLVHDCSDLNQKQAAHGGIYSIRRTLSLLSLSTYLYSPMYHRRSALLCKALIFFVMHIILLWLLSDLTLLLLNLL